MIKIGLIGAGRWGRNYIKTIEKSTSCSLNVVFSRNSEIKKLISEPCRILSSSKDFFEEDIHAVIIATPPKSHLEYIAMAVEKKIPLLVEKPLTVSLEEAIIVGEISKKTGSLMMVDHIHVFSHAFQVLKANTVKLGRIYEIETFAGNFGPYRNDVSVLWDWAPHDVSMTLDLLNATASDTEILSYDNYKVYSGTISESLYIKLNVKKISVKISISNHIQKTRIFRVYCERGIIEYDDMKSEKVRIFACQYKKAILDGEHQICKVSSEPPLDVVINNFVDSVKNKSSSHKSLDMGVEVVRIISEIEKFERH